MNPVLGDPRDLILTHWPLSLLDRSGIHSGSHVTASCDPGSGPDKERNDDDDLCCALPKAADMFGCE